MDKIRHLTLRLRAAEKNDDGDGVEGVLLGSAAGYGVEYGVGPGVKESLRAGAFEASLAERGGVLPVFYAHAWSPQKSMVPQPPIGAALADSGKDALAVEAKLFLDDSEAARSVFRAAEAGALREWSVGYIANAVETRENEDGTITEEIVEAELLEVSVVLKGANPQTEIAAVREAQETKPDDDTREREDARAAAAAAAEDDDAETAEWLWDRLDAPHVRDMLRESF